MYFDVKIIIKIVFLWQKTLKLTFLNETNLNI